MSEKKLAVVTGAARGIGRAVVLKLLEQDRIVAGLDINADQLKELESVVAQAGHTIITKCVDITDTQAFTEILESLADEHNGIGILINNAGITRDNLLLRMTDEEFDTVIAVNLRAAFVATRVAARSMVRNKFGRIINFATIATPLKMEGESVYAASKSAIESITKILAKEFSTYNITVNAIGPTPIYTDLIKNVPKEKMDSLLNMQTINRYGEFDDISNVIDFFLSDKSNFITGQVIFLGGVSY